MTVKRLADNRACRAMTAAEADDVFRRIAELACRRAAIAADYELRINALKQQASAELNELDAGIAPLERHLTGYITAHPERFVRPRMRKTDYGTYGLRSVTNVEIVDEMAAMISVKAQSIPAVVTTEKLDKKALETAIADGRVITGVELRSGEIAKYIVAKALLDQAKGGGA